MRLRTTFWVAAWLVVLSSALGAPDDEDSRQSYLGGDSGNDCHQYEQNAVNTYQNRVSDVVKLQYLEDLYRIWGKVIHNIMAGFQKVSSKLSHRELRLLPSVSFETLESKKKNAISVVRTPSGHHPRARTFRPASESTMALADDQDEEDPYIGIIFELFHYQNVEEDDSTVEQQVCLTPYPNHGTGNCRGCLISTVRYQLLEPLHLKLGAMVKHAMDFAYTPVLADQVEPVVAHQQSEYAPARVSRIDGRRDITKVEGMLDARQAPRDPNQDWWQWWIPWWNWDGSQDHYSNYRLNNYAFAGGSHGEVWRGRRYCHEPFERTEECGDTLIFKRLKIENGYRVLEAGLREIYYGKWLSEQGQDISNMYTKYVDHFFREQKNRALELWIVFQNAGPSLRSFLYTGRYYGDFIVYQHSLLWTKLRASVSVENQTASSLSSIVSQKTTGDSSTGQGIKDDAAPGTGKFLMREVMRQLVEAAAFLHSRGIVHRDIKPSNIMCKTNIKQDDTQVIIPEKPEVNCVLGDFSSAWNLYSNENLYTGGPSRLEQTDEYAPPEALFGDYGSPWLLGPAFDSWSIGIVALELLLGTPNVFSVDQRTKAILTQRMQLRGASDDDIERALYLAGLSQFCIYDQKSEKWPLRHGDPLHKLKMVKQSCTIRDFQRALHARDPLGVGFDSSTDTLLHLIWQLLAWDPKARMTASDALRHPYFNKRLEVLSQQSTIAGDYHALESQMLDPRMDMNIVNEVDEFACPKCGRRFKDWFSCRQHARGRKHANFCSYDKEHLPTCLNAHSLLPTHPTSGHCDIKGRRKVIEDFHTVNFQEGQQFYGIFDGHSGNRASKYATSFLFGALTKRLDLVNTSGPQGESWANEVIEQTSSAFYDVHNDFLSAVSAGLVQDKSGTTATVMLVRENYILVASLGDSRAVISSLSNGKLGAVQLTKDHTAADPDERRSVEMKGGIVKVHNGIARVNGSLVVTRSIGDDGLSQFLSRTPDVFPFSRSELLEKCGDLKNNPELPCFVILASDGLWDVVENEEAVLMVAEIVSSASGKLPWRESSGLQQAAEALVQEAYVRGSSDNIGVCVVAVEG